MGAVGNALSIWAEFRELLERTAGRVPSVSFDQTRLGDQRLYVGDIRKLRDHLGWAPKVGVEEGVRQLIK
jgi:CDP-paratose 2-epimerase